MKQRKCVKCREVIGRQRKYHYRRSAGQSYVPKCYGPATMTDLPPTKEQTGVHFRRFGSGYQEVNGDTHATAECGVLSRGWRRRQDGGVPWRRITSNVGKTTCHECLALLHVEISERLANALAMAGVSIDKALEQARGRRTMNGLRKAVGA